jgi:two-component system response regulator protein BraR/BceR
MSAAAATIIFAKDDLSIPGAAAHAATISGHPDAVEARFFDLVSQNKPDVIVLDCSSAPADGTDTILTVRQRTDIPILVVCDPAQSFIDEYRIAGAADCIAAPVDIISLNETIQKIIRVRGRRRLSVPGAPENFLFAGMRFYPHRNLLAGDCGSTAELTSSEGRLLAHFLSKPWTLCTRSEIAELLYGAGDVVGGRAIYVVLARLRKKVASVGGADAEHVIKTEFRRGYLLVVDVAKLPHEEPAQRSAVLQPAG